MKTKALFTYSLMLLSYLSVNNVVFAAETHTSPHLASTTEIANLDTKPTFTNSSLLDWATDGVIAAYTYGFATYKQDFKNASDYFTPEGWHEYQRALKDSKNLEQVLEQKIVVSATPLGTAVFLKEGVENKKYTWIVQVPLLVNYQPSSGDATHQRLNVQIKVTRVATNIREKGIGISQIIGRPE